MNITRAAVAADQIRNPELPPGPSQSPLIQTWRYVRNPLPLFDQCQREFGDMFTLQLIGMGRWVFLASPQLVREMFHAPVEIAHAGAVNYQVFGTVAGKHTVFTKDGADHAKQRKLVMPHFHGERMRNYVDTMVETCAQVLQTWSNLQSVALHPQLQEITMQIIVRSVFGLGKEARHADLIERLVWTANNVVGSSLLMTPGLQKDWGRWSPWGRLMHGLQQTDQALYSEISHRRKLNADADDIFSLLLTTKGENGEQLSDIEVRDEMMTLLMAGHETTATSLAWAFEQLLSNADALIKATEEIDRVVGQAPLRREHMDQLPYLDAVIHEALRLRPIAPNLAARKLSEPFTIGGRLLPAGTVITNAVYLLQRRSESYSEPTQFRPERFLQQKPDPYLWAPFGGGSRRCLGMAFALWEMKVILATVLQHFHLQLNKPVQVARRGFFLAPSGGLQLTIQPRKKN